MASPALPLSDIVNVTVLVSAQSATPPAFNQGLIVGTSTAIPSVGANSRVRQYNGLAGMLSDGFTVNSPEYLAAQAYFGQTPPPQFVWIGRQDLTAIKTFAVGAGQGTGYLVGDVLAVVQGGASGGTVTVATIGGSGQVTAVTLLTGGTGYAIASNLATTGGTGSGAQISISAIGETPLAAVTACRAASSVWWACLVTGSVAADHTAIAAFVQAMTPLGCYFYTTGDVAVLNGTAGNIGALLKASAYTRVFGVYSTTQGGVAPNNIYAAAAAMGVAMGLNTGLANSYFTMKFKLLTGIIPEPLTEAQRGVIEANNVNVYVGYANSSYTISEQGTTPLTGTFLDEILARDMLISAIQFNIMNLLTGTPSIPQTDPGQTQLIHAVNQACEDARERGYIAPGNWTGVQVLNLFPGDPLPTGYESQSLPYSKQSPADHIARKAMPIYTTIIEAGAVHSLTIGVYIQA